MLWQAVQAVQAVLAMTLLARARAVHLRRLMGQGLGWRRMEIGGGFVDVHCLRLMVGLIGSNFHWFGGVSS